MGYNHQWAVELFQEFLTRYQKELTAPMICAAEFAIDAHKDKPAKVRTFLMFRTCLRWQAFLSTTKPAKT